MSIRYEFINRFLEAALRASSATALLAQCRAMQLPAARHSPQPDRPGPKPRAAYRAWRAITTRWMDNDQYGHVNNVVYYSWFDTAVNAHLIECGALDPARGAVIGLVVQTQCHYFAPLSFPQTVEAGIRVAHIGASSVRYEVGLFAQDAPETAAHGHFVHVYVDRATNRPVPLPAGLRRALEAMQ